MKRSGYPLRSDSRARRLRLALAIPLALLLPGCMTLAAAHLAQEEQTAARLRPFKAEEHAWALESGAPVSGTVVLDTMWAEYSNGHPLPAVRKVLTCEGRTVRLIPDTPHMRWMLDKHHMLTADEQGYWSDSLFLTSDWIWPAESRAVVRETTCGPGGAFHFDDVPDGPYLVMALIESPDDRETASDIVLKPVLVRAQGGAARLEVELKDNWMTGPIVRH